MKRASSELPAPLGPVDIRLTRWMARHGVPLLRISLGVVFLWFGALKFFPGVSPAQDLAARTITMLSFGLVGPAVSLPVLAAWECLIGLGLLSGRFMRLTLLLLAVQMAGTLTPVVLFPGEVFARIPYAPTLEGQYIIKNAVLISAALVLGATVRGGGLVADPLAEVHPDSGTQKTPNGLPANTSIIIPRLVCRDPASEVDFCVHAFEAIELNTRPGPDGRLAHALLKIGPEMVMIEAEWPTLPSRAPAMDAASPVVIFVYVTDVDKVIERARMRGAKLLVPPANQFWGDRIAWLMDPAGHVWTVATRIEQTTAEERTQRWEKILAKEA